MHKASTGSNSQARSSSFCYIAAIAAATLLFGTNCVSAHSGGAVVPHKLPTVEVHGELPPPPAGVASIKFGEFFRMPVGPYGLEPSEKLLALNGKRVRLVGYMVREENPAAGCFILTPLPVTLGDEDEALSDDLPPSTVFVHLASSRDRNAPYIPGLIHLTGTLEVGAKDEAEGRVSAVRLILDAPISKRILGAKPMTRAASK
jgi:hypothetical protein